MRSAVLQALERAVARSPRNEKGAGSIKAEWLAAPSEPHIGGQGFGMGGIAAEMQDDFITVFMRRGRGVAATFRFRGAGRPAELDTVFDTRHLDTAHIGHGAAAARLINRAAHRILLKIEVLC